MNKKKEDGGGKDVLRFFLIKGDNYSTKELVRSCFTWDKLALDSKS